MTGLAPGARTAGNAQYVRFESILGQRLWSCVASSTPRSTPARDRSPVRAGAHCRVRFRRGPALRDSGKERVLRAGHAELVGMDRRRRRGGYHRLDQRTVGIWHASCPMLAAYVSTNVASLAAACWAIIALSAFSMPRRYGTSPGVIGIC